VAWTKNGVNCSGTTNSDCVDDVPGTPDDLSGYNEATAAATDRLNTTGLGAEVPSDADIISVTVLARFGGDSTAGTRQCRVSIWDETGTKTQGPVTSLCDINGWNVMGTNDRLVFDAGTRTKADINDPDFDIGYEWIAATNRVTALWANVEWIEAPAAPSCGTRMSLTGVGC
jgi:hypothetical protein